MVSLTQQRMPASPCPHCGTRFDAATGLALDGPATPHPGALTMCIECGRWLVFTDALQLRIAEAHEIANLHPTLRKWLLQFYEQRRGTVQ